MFHKTFCAAFAATLLSAPAHAASMYGVDVDKRLATVETSTGAVSFIGDLGVQLTDIAFDPSGNLFGISYTDLYSVNAATAAASLVGSLGVTGATGLVFDTDGALLMAREDSTDLYDVNVATGAASSLGG